MWPEVPHRWALTPREAIAVQRVLAQQVSQVPSSTPIRTVAGLDAAFTNDGRCIGGVVLWDLHDHTVLEERVAVRAVSFPYIPGLLSFREAPALVGALRKLERLPDALMCDGHGYAHPRRCGLACHIGVICDRPAVGCAKSRLIGIHRQPGERRGSRTQLRDGNHLIGMVVRTRTGTRPVFVSVGTQIDLPGAVRLVLRCGGRFRLPEPVRRADRLVARLKRDLGQPAPPRIRH